jgi:hypothetical protein
MASRTTEWRRRKFGKLLDKRGRNSNDLREDRVSLVGAVVAQLLAQGFATHHGLKTYGQRVGTEREGELKARLTLAMTAGDSAETMAMIEALNHECLKAECGNDRPVWVAPSDAVMNEIRKILSCRFNPDCMALAAAHIGRLNYITRTLKLRGRGYSKLTPCRESSSVNYWKAIDGMNRKTASYWQNTRKVEFMAAMEWLLFLLKKHGFDAIDPPDEVATVLRDDLADAMAGKVLKIPKTDGDIRFADEKQLAKLGMESRRRRD